MIRVQKGRPPPALVTYRATPDTSVDPPRAARYDGPGFDAVKPHVRAALVRDQRGLCCYCMARIEASERGMKIEHRVPQRGPQGDAQRDLDWSNLLGACCGVIPPQSGSGASITHCDSAKSDTAITIDPTQEAHARAIGYERSGRVTSAIPEHQRDIDDALNLNDVALCALRAAALDPIKRLLRERYPARSAPAEALLRLRDAWLPDAGDLRPYAGFVAWWLARAAARSAR